MDPRSVTDRGGPVTEQGYKAEGIYAGNFPPNENDSIFGQIQLAVQAQATPLGQLWPGWDMTCS